MLCVIKFDVVFKALSHSLEKRILASSCSPSVCKHVSARLLWTDFRKLDIGVCCENMSRKSILSYNRTNISATVLEDLGTVDPRFNGLTDSL
jgi:hypothetical protein